MVQDRKAIQAGTSHFLGQNFSKASGIQFVSRENKQEYAWTTSWGASTRLIGTVIMAHGDDDGCILPPRISPAEAERLRSIDLANADQLPSGSSRLVATLVWSKYASGKLIASLADQTLEHSFAGWADLLAPMPFVCPQTGTATFHLAGTDDHRLAAAERIAACEISGRRVLDTELVACTHTGRRATARTAPVTSRISCGSLANMTPAVLGQERFNSYAARPPTSSSRRTTST